MVTASKRADRLSQGTGWGARRAISPRARCSAWVRPRAGVLAHRSGSGVRSGAISPQPTLWLKPGLLGLHQDACPIGTDALNRSLVATVAGTTA